MKRASVQAILGLSVAALVAAAACGGGGYGGGNTPTAPSSGGTPPTSGATITIGANGVSPAQVTISVGQAVTFTNSSGGQRNMHSDPHPSHGDCPAINSVALLAPGQSKSTGAFDTARSCGFHDHDDPGNASWRGTITVR